ncbi:MAG: hypothetical protein KDJ37_09185 [Hyphomicrobiaceae bacterium]|nr:hypothetical protein [Hyphomicrobiaceae bacterium]
MRILVNALIMAAEVAAVAAVAWTAHLNPLSFAFATFVVALLLGASLEYARLEHEIPFYFGSRPRGRLTGVAVVVIAGVTTFVRAIVAGIIAILTFSGTNPDRLLWIAVVFGCVLYLATNLLRLLAVRLDAEPSRWGYFRLAAPVGLAFSLGVAGLNATGLITTPDLTSLGRTILLDTPAKPDVGQLSELLFQMKLYIDSVVVTLLRQVVGTDWAPVIGVLVSVNVLTGFVIALYAVLIAEIVVRTEDLLL